MRRLGVRQRFARELASGLEAAAGRRMGEYSGGMKRRVDLASALIHEPPIVFLDEPTEGLDPHARNAIWATLERLDATVFLTTHYMEEAERLCNRIAMIDQGRIVVEGSPRELGSLEQVYLRSTVAA